MRRVSQSLIVWAAAVGIAGCDHALEAEVKVSRLCLEALGEKFPGAPAILPPGLGTPVRAKPVMIDFAKSIKQVPGASADLGFQAHFAEIVLRSDDLDLGFVRMVAVSLDPGGGTVEPLALGTYQRDPAGTPAGLRRIVIPSPSRQNVFKQISKDPASMRFTISGDLPPESFDFAVEACLVLDGEAGLP